MRASAALACVTTIVILAGDAQAQWIPSAGESCDNVCGRLGRRATSSGGYVNGHPFFVCSGNAGGQGPRAGYNLRPAWATACFVGWGGLELPVTPFHCLCTR